MCLSRFVGAQHQRLQARVEHERRDRVDELRLEELDRRAPRRGACATSCGRGGRPAAGPDRGWPSGKRWPWRSTPPAAVRTCESAADVRRPAARQRAVSARRRQRRARQHVVAPQPSIVAEQARSSRRRACARGASSRVHHVPIEAGRAAHGLARVVDDVVEPVVGRRAGDGRTPRRSGVWRRSRP